VARMGGEKRLIRVFWWGNLRQGEQLEEPAIDGRIILKWTLMKSFGKVGTGLICIRTGASGEKNKNSGST